MHAVVSVKMWAGAVQFWHPQMRQLGIYICSLPAENVLEVLSGPDSELAQLC